MPLSWQRRSILHEHCSMGTDIQRPYSRIGSMRGATLRLHTDLAVEGLPISTRRILRIARCRIVWGVRDGPAPDDSVLEP